MHMLNVPVSKDNEEVLAFNAEIYGKDWDKFSRLEYYFRLTRKELSTRSFVIESLPQGTGYDCYRTKPVDLKPEQCTGDLHLREPTKHDY